jgi:hypothetical protein
MVEFKPEYRNTIRRGSLPTRPQIAFMTHNLINSYLFYDKYFDSFYLKLKKYFVEIQKFRTYTNKPSRFSRQETKKLIRIHDLFQDVITSVK